MSPIAFLAVCAVCGLGCALLAMLVHFFGRRPDPDQSLNAVISRVVSETIVKVVDERLPSLIEEIMTAKFEREPNVNLTNAGFGWALSIALRKHWPNLDGKTAARWLWDYIDVPYGSKGYVWTYAAAREIAAQYVSDFGEAA